MHIHHARQVVVVSNRPRSYYRMRKCKRSMSKAGNRIEQQEAGKATRQQHKLKCSIGRISQRAAKGSAALFLTKNDALSAYGTIGEDETRTSSPLYSRGGAHLGQDRRIMSKAERSLKTISLAIGHAVTQPLLMFY